jgi:hypothetical protein
MAVGALIIVNCAHIAIAFGNVPHLRGPRRRFLLAGHWRVLDAAGLGPNRLRIQGPSTQVPGWHGSADRQTQALCFIGRDRIVVGPFAGRQLLGKFCASSDGRCLSDSAVAAVFT